MSEDNMRQYTNSKGTRYPAWCKELPSKWFAKLFPHPTPKQITAMKKRQDAYEAERQRTYGHSIAHKEEA